MIAAIALATFAIAVLWLVVSIAIDGFIARSRPPRLVALPRPAQRPADPHRARHDAAALPAGRVGAVPRLHRRVGALLRGA